MNTQNTYSIKHYAKAQNVRGSDVNIIKILTDKPDEGIDN